MYADYGGFGKDYFENRNVSNPHEAGYSEYSQTILPFGHYANQSAQILESQGVTTQNGKALIVGCAYGLVVEQLRQNGYEVWGMDISQFAVDNDVTASQVVMQGDVLNSNDIMNVRQASPGGKFDTIMTECVLECLTDSEAQTAAQNCRDEAKNAITHRVWTTADNVNATWYNDKSLSSWQSLVDPSGDDNWYTEGDFQP